VKVAIENSEIVEIKILSCDGDKYDGTALPVLDRVVQEQNLDVDAVSGATKTSKLYLSAIHNALTGEEIDFLTMKM